MITLEWRSDLDALVFLAPGGSRCFVHRLAFRTLLGKTPVQDDCLRFFRENSWSFLAAAEAHRETLPMKGRLSFHLTSRHIKQQISSGTGSQLA
ncbi:hypothetical protein ACA106_06085 [Agrobacterium pusense]|uniref:DUF1488 domain-containing protein n=1 Tax=Agrobacterium pusense TaxID=648995 RepID=U4Q480_9HYPH|nr:hypothetical protein [Agrobacterium pusense]CDI12114.1 conserved protein of unknown function [Agrobacterium pusense]